MQHESGYRDLRRCTSRRRRTGTVLMYFAADYGLISWQSLPGGDSPAGRIHARAYTGLTAAFYCSFLILTHVAKIVYQL